MFTCKIVELEIREKCFHIFFLPFVFNLNLLLECPSRIVSISSIRMCKAVFGSSNSTSTLWFPPLSLMSMEGILTTYGQNGECYSIDGDGYVVCKLLNFISACYWLPLCGAFFCFESSSFILFSYGFIAYLDPCIIHHEIVYFAMLNRK